MIKKQTIIITSLGRTGTKFFATFFDALLTDATVLHEPDVINIGQAKGGLRAQIADLLRQLGEAGVSNLLVRRALGLWSLIEISDARLCGRLDRAQAAEKLLARREHFVQSRPSMIYVESNIAYYGILDVLEDTFENYRAVCIVRDGRKWVQSHINWGLMYGKGPVRRLIAHTWPTAPEIIGEPYAERWQSMSRFERLCWAWVRLNEYALSTIPTSQQVQLFRFEDIFQSDNRYKNLLNLVRFATNFPGIPHVDEARLVGSLEHKIHKSSGQFPDWEHWTIQQQQQFHEICGPLMERLAYKFE